MLAGDRTSSDGNSIADTIAEFTDGEGIPEQLVPVKKLSDAFDSCAKGEGQMKVYLRIRPISAKCMSESTITVDSGRSVFLCINLKRQTPDTRSIFYRSDNCNKCAGDVKKGAVHETRGKEIRKSLIFF